MEETAWAVEPVGPLRGDVRVSGSKNAVTKHMVAALLGTAPSRIDNAPRIGDIDITAGMMLSLGADVVIEDGSVTVDPSGLSEHRVPLAFSGLNRIPILFLGPLLHRVGEAEVPLVGGDRIGARPVDFHVDALRALGAEVEVNGEAISARATRLRGAHIRLPYPSVMATETVLLSASLAQGRTVVENCAIEPEVVELALFLQRMGARVELRPDRRFVVEGVRELSGAAHRLGGDRLEAFSYLVAGLVTGGAVRVFGCAQDRLVTAISTLQRMGARFEITDEWVAAEVSALRSAAVATGPHPGFMTDWHPPLLVLFTQSNGMSVMHETVFEDRLRYVDGLRQMGAEVEVFDQCLVGQTCRFHDRDHPHSAVVRGASPLEGADVEVPDVRAGFSYLLAASAAKTDSTLSGIEHIDRAYDRPLEKFSDLGLRIRTA